MILIGIIFYLGDKWIIGELKASKGNIPTAVHHLGDNLKYKTHLESANFLTSEEYSRNIYFFQTANHKPVMVIGNDLINSLLKEEMEALLFLFFKLINQQSIRNHTWCNLFMLFFEWPKLLMKFWGIQEHGYAFRLMTYLLFPFHLTRYLAFEKNYRENINTICNEIKSQYGLDIFPLFFKINKMHTADIAGRLKNNQYFENFALVPCHRASVLDQIIYGSGHF